MATFQERAPWRNDAGHESAGPLRTFRPADIAEVVGIVQEAEARGVTVRAVGSSHSWSDVARPDGYLVRTDAMCDVLELDAALMRRHGTLVHVQAGITIRELNRRLADRGLALSIMGGYDGQTVAGVISTSTHGSGRDFGPLNDAVRSIDVVAAHGIHYRIERSDGPTDPVAWRRRYAETEHRLVQADPAFDAVVVSMGCLGVICSVMLEVVPAFLLTERRTATTWEREALRIDEALGSHRHYELLLTPHADASGEHACMITTRDVHTGPAPRWWSSRSRRNLFAEAASALPGTGLAFQAIERFVPRLVPGTIAWALGQLADDEFTGPSYRVLNIGAANALPAMSMEIGVPVDASARHIAAMEAVFHVAAEFRSLGSVYHTAPISLRFVAASPALMSMMHGRELTMMIELILLEGTYGGQELLTAYERALRPLGGRPHWGQINHLTGGDIRRLYSELDAWLAVHAALNATGVFDSAFSRRLGIADSRLDHTRSDLLSSASEGRDERE